MIQLKFRLFFEYLIVCAVFALINSKILFVISKIPSMDVITINELIYNLLNGGIVFYGGLFGVILGILVVSRKRHISTTEMLDFAAPAFPLFHAFARLGCLLAGCCYGIEWNWGVIMMDEPGIVRFPVQFIECICDLFIFIGLILLERKRKKYKNHFTVYLCSYAICRFVLEFYRADTIRGIWFGGLSTSQYISILILIFYGWYFIHKIVKIKMNADARG